MMKKQTPLHLGWPEGENIFSNCLINLFYEQSMVEGVGNNKFKHQKTLDHIHYRKDIHIRFKFHFDVIYKKIHNSLEI